MCGLVVRHSHLIFEVFDSNPCWSTSMDLHFISAIYCIKWCSGKAPLLEGRVQVQVLHISICLFFFSSNFLMDCSLQEEVGSAQKNVGAG